jgi:hypothetical protein
MIYDKNFVYFLGFLIVIGEKYTICVKKMMSLIQKDSSPVLCENGKKLVFYLNI